MNNTINNNNKLLQLSDSEMQKIAGGGKKWVTKTVVRGECTKYNPWGTCAELRLYTETFQENVQTGATRNVERDTY